jgi:hypothetical protein
MPGLWLAKFQGRPERLRVEQQFHDGLAQPEILRFEERMETFSLATKCNVVLLAQFPIRWVSINHPRLEH